MWREHGAAWCPFFIGNYVLGLAVVTIRYVLRIVETSRSLAVLGFHWDACFTVKCTGWIPVTDGMDARKGVPDDVFRENVADWTSLACGRAEHLAQHNV